MCREGLGTESILEKRTFEFRSENADGCTVTSSQEDYSRSEGQRSGSHGKNRQILSVVHLVSCGLRSGKIRVGVNID